MSNEKIELVRGSGNVLHDFGHPHADVEQAKALLAARFIGILDDGGLSTWQAEAETGVNHSEFARIRRAKLDRFTIDRLMTIINRLGSRMDVQVTIRPKQAEDGAPVHGRW